MRTVATYTMVALAIAAVGAASATGATYTLTTLASFVGYGSYPEAGIMLDGNLYGTTIRGGTYDDGTIFKLAAGTNAITTLVSFDDTNGASPSGGLIADAYGNLYGTTMGGGAYDCGTVYQLAAGTNELTTLASFNGANGAGPWAGLIADADGNLYGTTHSGGTYSKGTVFKLAAGTNELTTLASFNGANGANPDAGLIADAEGSLYGTTWRGGDYDYGTVFQVAAGTNALTTLVSFDGANGAEPWAGLVADAGGNLYGTTYYGGVYDEGTVFRLAAGANTLTTLVSFHGPNGAFPRAGLIADADGNLYGTTEYSWQWEGEDVVMGGGTVFQLAADTNTITTLATFGRDIASYAPVIADVDGNLYGSTYCDPDGPGTVFRLSPVPEPSAFLLLVLGSMTALALRSSSR
jgi:uncharacterized repeat protein (TIGR03803 family)